MPLSGADTCTLGGVTLDLEPIPPYSESPKRVGSVERMLDGTYEIQTMGSDIVWNCVLTYVTDATLASLVTAISPGAVVEYVINSVSKGHFIVESFGPPSRGEGESHWTLSMSMFKVSS